MADEKETAQVHKYRLIQVAEYADVPKDEFQHWIKFLETNGYTVESAVYDPDARTYYICGFFEWEQPRHVLIPPEVTNVTYAPPVMGGETPTEADDDVLPVEPPSDTDEQRNAPTFDETCVCGKTDWERKEQFDPIKVRTDVFFRCRWCGHVEREEASAAAILDDTGDDETKAIPVDRREDDLMNPMESEGYSDMEWEQVQDDQRYHGE